MSSDGSHILEKQGARGMNKEHGPALPILIHQVQSLLQALRTLEVPRIHGHRSFNFSTVTKRRRGKTLGLCRQRYGPRLLQHRKNLPVGAPLWCSMQVHVADWGVSKDQARRTSIVSQAIHVSTRGALTAPRGGARLM